MKLYSIRHKVTGKFYNADERYLRDGQSRGSIVWGSAPIFYRTVDGISKSLRRIGCELVHVESRWGVKGRNRTELKRLYAVVHDFKCFDNFEPNHLKDIEVIVTNVSVLGEESYPASDFLKEEATA
jgi:hypothetical protein